MVRFFLILCSLCLLLVILLFIEFKKPDNFIEDTTGLIPLRVCVEEAETINLQGKKAIKLKLSYNDQYGVKHTINYAVYGYTMGFFESMDSLTMYQNPLSPEILKHTSHFK